MPTPNSTYLHKKYDLSIKSMRDSKEMAKNEHSSHFKTKLKGMYRDAARRSLKMSQKFISDKYVILF